MNETHNTPTINEIARMVLAQMTKTEMVKAESYDVGFSLAGQSGWNTRDEAARYAKETFSGLSKLDFNRGWKARRPGR